MSIVTAIQSLRTKIAAAYTSCNNKSADMPSVANQNLSNLASTIDTIVTDIPGNETIQIWRRVETTDETTGETTVSYEREEEYVGKNYTIPQWKYTGDTSIISVLIPSDMRFGTNPWAFQGCSNLQYVNLENITYMDGNVFGGTALCMPLYMPKLTGNYLSKFSGTNIPEIVSLGTLTAISQECFINCKKLKTANLPDTLTSISSRAFEGCSELETITANNLQTIYGRAFYYCTKLNCTLPQSITMLQDGAFDGCSSLTIDVNLPNLTTLGQAFRYSGIVSISNLGSITSTTNGSTITGTFCHCNNLQSVVLPSTLTTIGSGTFADNYALTSVTFNSGLTTIGGHAFSSCTSLNINELSLPNLTTLGEYAFRGCLIRKIKNLGSITRLEDGSGNGSTFGYFDSNWSGTLTEVWLPVTLTYIGRFTFYGQVNLTSLVCLSTVPPTLYDTDVFWRTPSTLKIYVPYSSNHSVLNAYKTATNWVSYSSQIYELNQNGTIPV